MIGAERGRGASTDDRSRTSAPVARIALDALARNARGLGGRGSVADLRADAWGHGAARVAAVLHEAAVESVVADPSDAAAIVRSGFAPNRISIAGAPTIDPLVLYGLTHDGRTNPVMSLSGTVLSVKDLLVGEGVSYGYLHRASADTRVALVSGGYAQGIVRVLGGRIDAAIAGAPHPVIGRIAMDACVIDIGGAPTRRGDAVTFFGDPSDGCPSLEIWTRASGLTAAEIVTGVGRRVMREYSA